MKVGKWGNSLAIRLPAALVEALDLKHGDQVAIRAAARREIEVVRDGNRQAALASLRKLRRPFPAGFTFDRNAEHVR